VPHQIYVFCEKEVRTSKQLAERMNSCFILFGCTGKYTEAISLLQECRLELFIKKIAVPWFIFYSVFSIFSTPLFFFPHITNLISIPGKFLLTLHDLPEILLILY